MPVFYCNGPECQRMISVSAIPGGNPTALAEPEKFAVVHQRCSSCGQRFCDRCLENDDRLRTGSCAACGAKLAEPPQDEAMRIMLGQQSAEGAAATVRLEPSPEVEAEKKPWWKFW
jgi:hypothetical protein